MRWVSWRLAQSIGLVFNMGWAWESSPPFCKDLCEFKFSRHWTSDYNLDPTDHPFVRMMFITKFTKWAAHATQILLHPSYNVSFDGKCAHLDKGFAVSSVGYPWYMVALVLCTKCLEFECKFVILLSRGWHMEDTKYIW